jgi:hypothetical protein
MLTHLLNISNANTRFMQYWNRLIICFIQSTVPPTVHTASCGNCIYGDLLPASLGVLVPTQQVRLWPTQSTKQLYPRVYLEVHFLTFTIITRILQNNLTANTELRSCYSEAKFVVASNNDNNGISICPRCLEGAAPFFIVHFKVNYIQWWFTCLHFTEVSTLSMIQVFSILICFLYVASSFR